MKKKRLNIEKRLQIEQLLKLNYKLKDISNIMECSSSTISREIKGRRKPNGDVEICDKTNRYPFICFNCRNKVNCIKKKYTIMVIEKHKMTTIRSLNVLELE